jgi:hypothetical protein
LLNFFLVTTTLLHAPIIATIMTSDASLPPNAPTTLKTLTMTAEAAASSATNGSLTPQQSSLSNSAAQHPRPSDLTTAVRSVGGEADASLDLLDDEHDGTELDVPPNPVPLSEVCRDVNARVTAFLALDAGKDEAVRKTQEHVRASADVIAQALQEYG